MKRFSFKYHFVIQEKKLHRYSFANERVTKKHKRMNSFCHIGDKDPLFIIVKSNKEKSQI